MTKIKIKENLNQDVLKELGYTYSMMEGGFVSEDCATIISIDRRPYEREVMQFIPNAEDKHMKNIEKLREIKALES